MSYETTNYLPKGVSKRHAAEFAELLGYKRAGGYARLGMPEVVSMIYFEEKDYKSWETVELSIGISEEKGVVYVHTRTRVGRSHYDFEMQNRTAREFRRRFGGTAVKDGGNGEGYDPGPPVPPAASGCYLAMQRLDWNLTRVNHYLHLGFVLPDSNPLSPEEMVWPQMRQLNPHVFISNVLITYLVSAMEDYFKSSYIALLTYAERKPPTLLRFGRKKPRRPPFLHSNWIACSEATARLVRERTRRAETKPGASSCLVSAVVRLHLRIAHTCHGLWLLVAGSPSPKPMVV